MAEADQDIDFEAMWTVRLDKVERLDPDEPDNEDHFAVDFELMGPAANGTVTVMVFDPRDEADIVGTARDALRDGLKRWLQVLERQPGAEPIESTER